MAKPTPPAPARKPVDWSAVHARLAQASLAPAPDSATQTARDAEILSRRARVLAQPPLAAEASAETRLRVICFTLNQQSLALDASFVRETVQVRELTPLPGLPPFVRGLANVRSRVLPAFDLRPLLHIGGRATATAGEQLLIVAWSGAEFALVVDEVTGSHALSLSTLRRDVPGLSQKFLRGLSVDGHVLLDGEPLFAGLRVSDDSSL